MQESWTSLLTDLRRGNRAIATIPRCKCADFAQSGYPGRTGPPDPARILGTRGAGEDSPAPDVMTGLKQRILGRRSASPSDQESPPPADAPDTGAGADAPDSPPSLFGTPSAPAVTPDDIPTISHTTASGATTPPEQPAPEAQDAEPAPPAGADADAPARPGFIERGRMRRRLRYLRRAHELGLRDLGGLVFDLRRFRRQRFDLVEAKLQTLTLVDQELRTLEAALADRRPLTELREAGIASCARCGALTATDANFCATCGLQIGDAPPIASPPPAVAAGAEPAAATPAPAPATPAEPEPDAAPAVRASDVGATPLSTGTPPANGSAADAPAFTSGDPLSPPPAGR